MDEQAFSIKDVFAIFRRRARMIVAISGGTFLASVFIAAVLRDQYTVAATLLVEPQSISRKLVESGQEEADVMNRLHLMTMQILSRARLSKVIDDLKLYVDESETRTREQVIDMMRGRIRVDPVLPEIADPELRRRMQIDVNTFRLYFRHDQPGVAAAVANRLANDFIDEHIKERVQSSGDTADFVESELQRLAGRLRELESQIAGVKAQNAGSLPEDVVSNQRQVERAFDQLTLASQRLAEAQSDQAFYTQQAAAARDIDVGTGTQGNLVLSPTQRLQALENHLGELRSRGFTDRHPDVIAGLAEMEQVRARIARGDEEESEDKPAASASEQNARNEAQRASLRSEAAQREVARLQQEMDAAQQRLANTPRVAEQLDALEREYTQLGASFNDFSAKRLDAAVAANMERRQKGEQFRVLEPAYAPPAPTSPNRPLILALGAMLGIGVGFGLALLLDAADSSYRTPRQVQGALRIPVLTAIPSILLDADRLRMHRRNLRDAFAAVALAGLMLIGSATGYVLVNRPNWLSGGEEEAPAVAPAAPAAQPEQPAVSPPGGPAQAGRAG
jgi:polysaccharide chain length determinant protein (PEP-CTERM system associated)